MLSAYWCILNFLIYKLWPVTISSAVPASKIEILDLKYISKITRKGGEGKTNIFWKHSIFDNI